MKWRMLRGASAGSVVIFPELSFAIRSEKTAMASPDMLVAGNSLHRQRRDSVRDDPAMAPPNHVTEL